MKDKNIYILVLVPLVLYGVAWLLYSHHVGSNVSTKSDDWGYFGSYIGGVLGPILTTASILFVWFQSKKGLELQQEQLQQQNFQSFIENYNHAFQVLQRAEEKEVFLGGGLNGYFVHHNSAGTYKIKSLIEDIKAKISSSFHESDFNGRRGSKELDFGKIMAYHRNAKLDKELGDMERDYRALEIFFIEYIAALTSLYYLFANFKSFSGSQAKHRDVLLYGLERYVDNGKTPHLMKVFDIGYGISKHNPLVS